jgi:hypothetical protein
VIEFLIGSILTVLVVAVILASVTFRDTAYCRRRERVVHIIDGRCQYRANACALLGVAERPALPAGVPGGG